tara:strand:- start:219 stop:515 length:297 start_codon:yes stop_codon:yes gene_type:complete
MPDKPKPGSYIDTQGMSGPTDPNVKSSGKVEYKPATVKPRRGLTSVDVMELKILIHEVLDEREGKFNYTSYFETEKYKHPVTEEEPDYKPRYKPAYYQ